MNDFEQSIFKQVFKNDSFITRDYYFKSICEYVFSLGLSRFRWNIPKEINGNTFLMESTLWNNNTIALIKNDFGFYLIPCYVCNFNVLQEPNQINIIRAGVNSEILNQVFETSPDNFIVCWNSLSRNFGGIYLSSLINDISETMFLQHSLFEKTKQPYLVQTNDKKVLENKILMNKIKNDEIIYSDDIDKVKVLNLEIESLHFDKLQNRLDDLLRRLHGYLGINYDIDPKRERLITTEVIANNELKDTFSQSFLKSRQNFCNEVKQKYNLEITVESVI